MIKVNLLRNTAFGQGNVSISHTMGKEAQRVAIIKLVVIFAFPVALYGYEQYNIGEAQTALAQKKAELEKLIAEKSKYGDAAPRIDKASKIKAQVDVKLEEVRKLSRNRLREVKALDALQTLTPENCWIKKISIDGDVVRLEGESSAEDGFAEFIKALESSVYFSKVEPRRTGEDSTGGGAIKTYELEFRIGKSE